MQPNTNPNQNSAPNQPSVFKFLSYYYDPRSRTATFCYQGIHNFIYTERVTFAPHPEEGKVFNATDDPSLNELLNRALFLAFIAIGTTYYKSHPTPYVRLDMPLDDFQAFFFNKIYQEGLAQLAYENHLTRAYLAHFYPTEGYHPAEPVHYRGEDILSLQSGGKDSILTATMLNEQNMAFTPWYLSHSPDAAHPLVIDHLGDDNTKNTPAFIAIREIDLYHLQQAAGIDGHTPMTLIYETLGLVQAILFNKKAVLTSLAQEATEPTTYIGDLPVNHQWSKSWECELLLAEYVKRYLSPDLIIGSPIRHMSELRVAEQFTKKCWERYGYGFSSCQVAGYRQFTGGSDLPWCGNCARCANAYLLFCPFLPKDSLSSLFSDYDLFAREGLHPIFRSLLSIDGEMKPFESVGSVEELRSAYQARQEDYAALPFTVPPAHFDYRATYPVQPEVIALFKK